MNRTTLAKYSLPHKDGHMEAEIVLCYLPDNKVTPYVTWQHNLKDNAYYWGHYFSTENEARADFGERVR